MRLLTGKLKSSKDISINDLREYDQCIYNSMKFILEDDNIDFDLECFTFTVMKDGLDVEITKDGRNM